MSLDVYLSDPIISKCTKCGHEEETGSIEVFSQNITHNLGAMAREAGIYEHLWRPEELVPGCPEVRAAQLIEPLKNGLRQMWEDPARFKKHDSPNGWGLYEHFTPWIEKYLKACISHPNAIVSVSR